MFGNIREKLGKFLFHLILNISNIEGQLMTLS